MDLGLPLFISKIKEALLQGLPGKVAQLRMSPISRQNHLQPMADARNASVLILLYPKISASGQEEWFTVYIKRVDNTGHARHRGQISFPGGTKDDTDASLAFTALREANEEVGVMMDQMLLLGALSPLFIPVSNFNVHPYLAWSRDTPIFAPQPTEVAEIIEISIDELSRVEIRKKMEMQFSNGMTMPDVPYYDLSGQILWGATAMITSEFLALLES